MGHARISDPSFGVLKIGDPKHRGSLSFSKAHDQKKKRHLDPQATYKSYLLLTKKVWDAVPFFRVL